MAEAIALAASIIAVVQLADRIAGVCKSLIETVQDYPRDLRLIFIETGSLKVIFESLRFLNEDDPADSATLQRLRGPDGPVEGCKTAMDQLDQLFPTFPSPASRNRGAKRQRLQTALTSLAWPLKAERARKLLDEIMCHKSTINVALQGQLLIEFRSVKHRLDEVYVTLNASEKRKVCDWLQDTNPSPSHNAAKQLYEDKTGDWVFKTSEWDDWVNARIRALWIHGIPGAGKTILVAHIIQKTLGICEAKDKRTTCVYYYCYHGHNQDESTPLLRWLVSQLLRETDTVPTLAWEAYHMSGEPDTALLLDTLYAILDLYDLVYLAIDALDESQPRQNLLNALNTLTTDHRFKKMQLLATSREYSDIQLMMCRFSQPLSMSNRFVEADIKVYVTAKILTEPKFQRWPSDLRAEVEATLATGAKGMFRWTVCQLDILRRLNSQSQIREAIKSLPKTMDKTYERIFSYITDEEKELVRHTLHWVCFHDLLWKGEQPLSADILVDAYIAREKGTNVLSSVEYLYDLDVLKDSCGCLISFAYDKEDQSQSVNIAHYTVREFLESDRSSLASWFSIRREDSYSSIASFVLEYSMASASIAPSKYLENDLNLNLKVYISLHEYCSAASVHSLREIEDLIEPQLAFRFLNPLADHFETLQLSLSAERVRLPSFSGFQFWHFKWRELTESSEAVLLVNLLLIRCFSLAKKLIQTLDINSVFQISLSGSTDRSPTWSEIWELDGFECINLVEFFAAIGELEPDVLEFFQREAHSLLCYTELLLHYMPSHSFMVGHAYMSIPLDETGCNSSNSSCSLLRLLQFGANPDSKVFRITPLQIAVCCRDVAGVKLLLEAGADPNNSGDEQDGKLFLESSLLRRYNCLQGKASLHIVYHPEFSPYSSLAYEEYLVNAEIQRLLLDYGASDSFIEEHGN